MKLHYLQDPQTGVVREARRYLAVGAMCTLLDMALLYLLFARSGVNYVLASALSFCAGATLNYLLCTAWVFRYRRLQRRPLEFAAYLLITGVVLIVNSGLIWILTGLLGMYLMVSKLFAVAVTVVLNFSLRKFLLHLAPQGDCG